MIENTTINLVKDVIIITIDGAKDKMVINANTLKIRAVAVPVEASPKFRLTFCANAGKAKNNSPKKTAKHSNNFLDIFFFRLIRYFLTINNEP